MAAPRSDTYSAPSGGAIYAGMAAPPAWLAGKALNQWFQISGTSGAGGAPVNAYSGVARLGTKWVSACAGGHLSGLDNRVVAIDLSADAPAWSVLKAASSGGASDVAYYSDGKPASRHTYSSTFGISGNRVILPGLRYTNGGASTFDTVDAFDLGTNQWAGVVADSPGTSGSGLANVTPSGYYPVAQDANGDLWCILFTNGNVAKYTVATNSWSQPAMANQVSPNVRYPWALDTSRNQLFGLAWGDGEGFGTGLRAVVLTGSTQIAISFNASAALTQFQADAPQYAGMEYDPVNDRFFFYSGQGGAAGRMYIISPNSGTTWDMSILTTSGAALGGCSNPAPVKKLAYFPALKVMACLPDVAGNIYFMRLA